jgi:hypothetical protein
MGGHFALIEEAHMQEMLTAKELYPGDKVLVLDRGTYIPHFKEVVAVGKEEAPVWSRPGSSMFEITLIPVGTPHPETRTPAMDTKRVTSDQQLLVIKARGD